jgi:hypothetical protein
VCPRLAACLPRRRGDRADDRHPRHVQVAGAAGLPTKRQTKGKPKKGDDAPLKLADLNVSRDQSKRWQMMLPLDDDRAMAEATYRLVARAVLAFAARQGVPLSAGEIDALADQFVAHHFRIVLPSNDDGEP